MKKPYNSIRLVRVGGAGETQFERGSLQDTARKIALGENRKLTPLGQTLLSVLHTDLPPLPTKPFRRLSASGTVRPQPWIPKQRPPPVSSSYQELLSLICTGGENTKTKVASSTSSLTKPKSLPAAAAPVKATATSGRKGGRGPSRERMMMPPPQAPAPAPAPTPATPKRFSQLVTLSDESSSSEDEELDDFVMQRLKQLEAEEAKKNPLKRDRTSTSTMSPEKGKKRREGDEGSAVTVKTKENPEKEKKLRLENEILLRRENYQEISAVLKECQEMTFLLVLREGYSQFHHLPKILGSGFGTPQYLLVRIVQKNQRICFIKAELWNKLCSDQTKRFFWQEFIESRNEIRKLVYDGKALLNCIMSAMSGQIKLPPTLRLIDPIIGCWLLKPDHPVHSFKMVLEMILPALVVTNLGSARPSELAAQTEVLASVCRAMQGQLEQLNLWKLFYQTEMRILPALVSMERVGLTVDQAKLEDLGKLLQQKMMTVRAEAERLAGKPFNLSSPKQVREILYTDLRLDRRPGVVVAKTPGGEKSTSETVLLKLKPLHPLVGLVLQHRQLAKYKTTYVDGILSHLSLGRVSTCWDQIAAATGRVTSVSPNLQAVPKVPKGVTDLGEEGKEGTFINIRAVFQPSVGRTFLSADFEQIEFRIFGHLSQDPQVCQALREGGDVFNKLAAFWLDKSVADVSEEERDR